MEKVISKLSNEELDLVVGGDGFLEGYISTFTTGWAKDAATVAGKLLSFATLMVPAGLATGLVEYFVISKKGKKEAAK